MISVVVVNWNGKPLLADCLQSLRSQTFPGLEVLDVLEGVAIGEQVSVAEGETEARRCCAQVRREGAKEHGNETQDHGC